MKNVYKFILTTMMALCFTLYGVAQTPAANAGGDKTICENSTSYTLEDATASYTAVTWTHNGDGSWGSPTTENVEKATYYPGASDKTNGFVKLTLSASYNYPVTATSEMTLTISKLPSISALTLNNSTDETNWSAVGGTNPDFEMCVDSLNEYYYLDVNTLTANVALKQNEYNAFYLDETKWPTGFEAWWNAKGVNVGAGSGTWQEHMWKIINGTEPMLYLHYSGSDYVLFDGLYKDFFSTDATLKLNGNYPNGKYYFTGTVKSADDCVSEEITITLTIQQVPTANAGSDATICVTGTYTVDDASAKNYDAVTWTKGAGDGSFTGVATLTPTYTPGTNDKSNGSVTLTLHAEAISPCVTEDTDDMILTINALPSISAMTLDYSTDETNWSAVGGTNPDFELCVDSLNEYYYLDVNTLTANVALKQNEYNAFYLDETKWPTGFEAWWDAKGVNVGAGSGTWQEHMWKIINGTEPMLYLHYSGSDYVLFDGLYKDFFSTDATLKLNGNYPNGKYYFTGTVKSADDCVSEEITITLTIQQVPTANAGSDATICETATYTVNDATAANNSSVSWTKGTGDGFFTNGTTLTPTYTPGTNDKINGSVTLTLHAAATSPCVTEATDDMTLTFQANPTVEAGVDATICEDETYTLADATVTTGLYTAVTWTTSGDGDFDDDSALNPEYTPGETDADQQGGITLTLSAVPLTPCVVAITDDMNLFVGQAPEVDAGADQTICETGTSLDGTVDHELSTLWTTFGDGTFADANLEDTYYYPGSDDIDDGLVKLALVASPNIPCELMYSDDMYLYITQELPTVSAGSDDTGCSNEGYYFEDASVTNYENVLWVKLNADGTFVDPNIVNATYNFGPNDISNGFAVVKLVAQPKSPCIQLVEDEITLYVQNAASANVGGDHTICEDATYTFTSPYPPVSGTDVWASYVEYVSWSTSGSGTFTYPDTYCKPTGGEFLGADGFNYFKLGEIDNTTGHATNGYAKYMNLSTGLLANSSYTVTWRCGYVAGALASLWIDLNMDGTFQDSERLITNASINNSNSTQNFTVPSGSTPGEKRLRIRMRFAATGNNSSNPCNNFQYGETEDYTVFIVGANGNVVTPTYDPSAADVTAGSVNLTMTGRPVSPCTINAVDYMVLNLQKLPVANAGADETICETDTYTVSDATAANYSSLTWTTDGDGTFSGNPLTITYNPGSSDISGGGATLTLTLQPISPCTATDDDTMDLTIQLKPTVDAGDDVTVCEDICDAGKAVNNCLTLDATVGGGPNDGLLWTHDGDGSINSPTSEDTYYTPAVSDAGQTVEFTLTATCSDPCTGTVEDSFTAFFQELPEITAIGTGANATYCEDATAIPLNVTIGGGPYDSVEWTTDGDGTIADASDETTTYAASADDGNKTVTFTLTVTPDSPCETLVDSTFSVYIQKLPVADAGDDDTVCENGSYTLSDASATDYQSVSWMTTFGDGTFDNESLLNPTYTPGNGDIIAGSVVLQMLVAPILPCTTGDDDEITLNIQLLPVADAGSDATICIDGTYTVDDATADNEESVSWDHNGAGSLSDETTLTPTYTPGDGDVEVKLVLTAEPKDPCTSSDEDDMTIFVNPLPELTDVELQATKTSPVSWFDASGDLDGGYQLCIDGLAATNYNLDIDALTSTVALEPDVYNEFFQTGTVPADFLTWWAAKGVTAGATPGTWQATMWQIINGNLPIFYLLYDDGTKGFLDYKLIDGLQKQYASTDVPLTLPGDYPQGEYTFTGTVVDINGCISEEVTIAIEFVHAPIISAGSDATIANNQSYTVNDATAEHYTTITWSHDGDGTLTDGTGLTPTYDAAATDGGKTVTLTMYADGNSPCVQAWDYMEITIKFAPVVTITAPVDNEIIYHTSLYISYGTATDADGTIASVEVNKNGGGWTPASGFSAPTWNYYLTPPNPGKTTIQVRATDNNGYVSDVVMHTLYKHVQEIPLSTGWQLISSFLDPLTPTSVPTIVSGVVSNLVTMNSINPSGVYSPAPFNVNTIGNWNVMKGYKVKMKNPATLVISGDPIDDNSNVPFTAGFHYLPVLTDSLCTISDIFDNPGDPGTFTVGDIQYMTDLTNTYWPAGGLNNIPNLIPGRAYYAQFLSPLTVHFPAYKKYLVDEALHPQVAPVGPWPYVRGEVAHIISISQKALVDFEPGFIGAFNNNGQCIGFAEIAENENTGLIVFGDDSWTSEKDGAANGEVISFRYYNNNDQSETSLTAEYDITKPQYDGKFTENGLSMILSFYKNSTGVAELGDASIQIYPNPANDEITISYFGKDAVQEVSFTTVDGSIVRTQTLTGNLTRVNISDLAPGVYFVQFNTGSGTRFTKLVVQ